MHELKCVYIYIYMNLYDRVMKPKQKHVWDVASGEQLARILSRICTDRRCSVHTPIP